MVIKNNKVRKGILLTGAVISAAAACATATGKLQNCIKFADVDNEISFFMLTSFLSAALFLISFTQNK